MICKPDSHVINEKTADEQMPRGISTTSLHFLRKHIASSYQNAANA